MKPQMLLAFIGIALTTPGFAEEQKAPPPAQQFTLVCSSQLLKKTIAVDLAKKTIDGKAASFSATTIVWKTEEADAVWNRPERQAVAKRVVLHELNRLEGVYRSREDGASAASSLTYSCEKAPAPKF